MAFLMEHDRYGFVPQPDPSTDRFTSIGRDNSTQIAIKKKKNIFDIVDPGNLYESILEICKEKSEILGVDPSVYFLLLEQTRWDPDRLAENWTKDSKTLLSSIGLTPLQMTQDPNLKTLSGDNYIECSVCFDQKYESEFLCLPCGHKFCRDCWEANLSEKILHGEIEIRCLESGCNCRVPPESIEKICGSATWTNLLKFISDNEVGSIGYLSNCPNPPCSKPLSTLDKSIGGACKCPHCRFEFCIECGNESHSPITCSEIDRWNNYTNPELMQARLFGPNVKRCPNCKVVIEKNGGCNHMTCKHCHHEFCWMCMKDWKTHQKDFYHCAEYKEEDDPFLKKPDNVSPAILTDLHDEFVLFQNRASRLNAQRDKLRDAIVEILTKTSQKEDRSYADCAADFVDQMYWTYQNLRWSQALLFFLLFDCVKSYPESEQANHVPSINAKLHGSDEILYLRQKFYVDQLKNAANQGETFLENVENKKVLRQEKDQIIAMTRNIKIFRAILLRNNDPHFL